MGPSTFSHFLSILLHANTPLLPHASPWYVSMEQLFMGLLGPQSLDLISCASPACLTESKVQGD